MALRYTGYMMPSKSYHNHEPIYILFCVATTAESLNSKDICHVLVIEDWQKAEKVGTVPVFFFADVLSPLSTEHGWNIYVC